MLVMRCFLFFLLFLFFFSDVSFAGGHMEIANARETGVGSMGERMDGKGVRKREKDASFLSFFSSLSFHSMSSSFHFSILRGLPSPFHTL